jgi:hypothetical protein
MKGAERKYGRGDNNRNNNKIDGKRLGEKNKPRQPAKTTRQAQLVHESEPRGAQKKYIVYTPLDNQREGRSQRAGEIGRNGRTARRKTVEAHVGKKGAPMKEEEGTMAMDELAKSVAYLTVVIGKMEI